MFSNFGFNGGGISGGGISGMGFGVAGAPVAGPTVSNTAPLNQYLGASQSTYAGTVQQVGVAQYGSVWASSNCPSCNTNILEMQSLINRVGAALGAGINIAVDGKVGESTVSALRKVGTVASSRGSVQGGMLLVYTTPEQVAKNADTIRGLLSQMATVLPATTPTYIPPVTGGGSPIPTSTAVVPSVTSPPYVPPPATGFFAQNKKILLISGAILAVGAAAAIVILKTPAASAG